MYKIEEITNKIICGDNLEVMREIPDESVDLVYLDPPFFSSAVYEKIWGDKDEFRSFEDRWKGGIEVYISWMSVRLSELRRILKPTGTIYLHCDYHASHYLKVMMDKIFGENNYRTTIILERKSIIGNLSRRIFKEQQDYILVFSKTDEFKYKQITKKYSNEELINKRGFVYKCKENECPICSKGITNILHVWRNWAGNTPTDDNFSSSTKEMLIKGELLPSKTGNTFRYLVRSSDEKKIIRSIWNTIHRGENIQYPTQKPVEVIDRIVLACSDEGDIILDPFCGGGTTLVSAVKNKRNFIGIDQSSVATSISAKRLGNYNIKPILRMNVDLDDVYLMNPWVFQEWAIEKHSGITTNPNPGKPSGSDDGIDGYVKLNKINLYDTDEEQRVKKKWNDAPISVERRKVSQDDVDAFIGAMERHNKKYGVFVALEYTFTDEKIKKYGDKEIILSTAKDLCKVDKYKYEV